MAPYRWNVVLVGTTAAVFVAGCASGHDAPTSTAPVGILTVHIGLFGGPARPGGGMADSNAPQPDAPVRAVDGAGHEWNAQTGRDGVARLSIPPGHYTVTSSFCGSPKRVSVMAGQRTYVQIACDIP